jgi:hypothetical protein
MAQYRWAGGQGGSFALASNWIDEATGAAAPTTPGAGDSVDLVGAGAITGYGAVADLDVGSGSVFSFSATLAAATFSELGRLTLSGGMLQAGTMDVDGGGVLLSQGAEITSTGELQVGQSGQGTLFLSGSQLNTQGGLMLGSAQSGAQGMLQLNGSTWSDTGAVVVGNTGQGTLLMNSSAAGFASAAIDGSFDLGGVSGAGTACFTSSLIAVAGQTIIGASSGPGGPSTLTIQGGSQWTSQGGHGLILTSAAYPTSPNELNVTGAGAALTAGLLSIGQNAAAVFQQNASATITSTSASPAIGLAGELTVESGARLTVAGHTMLTGGVAAMLCVQSASASIVATGGPALALSAQTQAMVSGAGAVLSTTGGIAASGGTLTVSAGGVLSATGAGQPALAISGGGTVSLQTGVLNTTGLFEVAHGAVHGGALVAGSSTLASRAYSSASVPANALAVSIGAAAAAGPQNGIDQAQLTNSTWTIQGELAVGAGGQGTLTSQGSRIVVAGNLQIGGAGVAAGVTLRGSDSVVIGGTLAPGATGLSAQSATIIGAGSHLNAGTMQVGNMTISGGQADLSGGATIGGTLSLLAGGQLNAGSVTIDPGAAILGLGRISAGSILDQGHIGVTGGTLVLAGPVSGDGLLSVRAGTLDLTQPVASSLGVAFGNAGTIVTPSVADLAGSISGWQAGDAIDFTGAQIASFTFSAGQLNLFDSEHFLVGTETFTGALTSSDFTLTGVGGGTVLRFHG